jgi:hypothetical protein
MKFLRFFIGLLLVATFMPALQAHQVPSVELEFLNQTEEWWLEGEMDIAYMLPETRNVPGGLPLSRKAVMGASADELARIRKETEATLRKLLRITFADRDVRWRVEFPDFHKEPFALPPEAGDIALLTTRLIIDAAAGAGELRIHWAGEQETELIVLDEEADPAVLSTLPGGSLMLLKQTGDGAAAAVERPLAGGWFKLGFLHVLGIDHILFILGLFLLVPQWRPLLWQSLLFTLAHSVTLAIAVLWKLPLPGYRVGTLIAVSIAAIGIENLFRRQFGKSRAILVFCFGLLHGLGFASDLAAKVSGIPRSHLIGPLVGFNIGVEMAQIAILVGAFVVLWPLRKWTDPVRLIGSFVIALAGIAWVVQRLFFPASPLF